MKRLVWIVCSMVLFFVLAGCYGKPTAKQGASVDYTEHQLDSLAFQTTHHYTNNYNFVVSADSLELLNQQPEEMLNDMMVDTFALKKHSRVVVADIRIIPTDSIDSVWIQLAKDQETFGWTHESEMLKKVVPDDPISQFIMIFSDVHLIIFLIFFILILSVYIIRKIGRERVPMVHFNDIDTFYPALLCITVACSATLYATIQHFEPDMWRHFYYHPTLNPFSVPLILSLFLSSVWAVVLIGIAAVDGVRQSLPWEEAILYLGGTGAVCALNYVLFSITTLYYVGYVLLVMYIVFAVRQFIRHSFTHYQCGKCGKLLKRKGCCPHCGTMNY